MKCVRVVRRMVVRYVRMAGGGCVKCVRGVGRRRVVRCVRRVWQEECVKC